MPFELPPPQAKLEFASFESLDWIDFGLPSAMIPPADGAGAVFALGDFAFEVGVFERMVFDFDREASFAWLGAGSFRNGPALQDAFELEAEIVVIVRGEMMLNDEYPFDARSLGALSRGFPGNAEVPFTAILLARRWISLSRSFR